MCNIGSRRTVISIDCTTVLSARPAVASIQKVKPSKWNKGSPPLAMTTPPITGTSDCNGHTEKGERVEGMKIQHTNMLLRACICTSCDHAHTVQPCAGQSCCACVLEHDSQSQTV